MHATLDFILPIHAPSAKKVWWLGLNFLLKDACLANKQLATVSCSYIMMTYLLCKLLATFTELQSINQYFNSGKLLVVNVKLRASW